MPIVKPKWRVRWSLSWPYMFVEMKQICTDLPHDTSGEHKIFDTYKKASTHMINIMAQMKQTQRHEEKKGAWRS